jgi:hypothetical protein
MTADEFPTESLNRILVAIETIEESLGPERTSCRSFSSGRRAAFSTRVALSVISSCHDVGKCYIDQVLLYFSTWCLSKKGIEIAKIVRGKELCGYRHPSRIDVPRANLTIQWQTADALSNTRCCRNCTSLVRRIWLWTHSGP